MAIARNKYFHSEFLTSLDALQVGTCLKYGDLQRLHFCWRPAVVIKRNVGSFAFEKDAMGGICSTHGENWNVRT